MKIFDTEAETALLSLVVANPEKVYELQEVKWFMFSVSSYQVIWSAIEELREQNLIPERVLLFSKIEDAGKIPDVGGKDFIDALFSFEYKLENLSQYERSVVNNYRLKQVLTLNKEIQDQVKNNTPVEEVLNFVKDSVAKLDGFITGEKTISLLDAIRETWKDIKERINSPGIPGIPTKFIKLDLVTYGYNPEKLWVIASRPSVGKSLCAVNMMLKLGEQGVPSLLLSKEMPYIDIVRRMIAIESGVSISDIMIGNFDKEKLTKVEDTISRIKNYPIEINDKFLPFDLLGTIRRVVKQKNIKVVFIDYLQLLTERGEEQTEELGRIIRSLKLLTKELGITIIVLAQLNRLVELRPDKRPVLSDIRQCGNVEEDVDIAIFLYRDELYKSDTKHPNELEWIIRKNRMGSIGTIPFILDAPTNRIEEINDL